MCSITKEDKLVLGKRLHNLEQVLGQKRFVLKEVQSRLEETKMASAQANLLLLKTRQVQTILFRIWLSSKKGKTSNCLSTKTVCLSSLISKNTLSSAKAALMTLLTWPSNKKTTTKRTGGSCSWFIAFWKECFETRCVERWRSLLWSNKPTNR